MKDTEEIRRQLLNAFCVRKKWVSAKDPARGSPSKLSAALGRTPQFWSDRLGGLRPIKAELAREIEDYFFPELQRFELDGALEDLPREARAGVNPANQGAARGTVAQDLSHGEDETPLLKWEELMSTPLPDVFRVALRDAVFAPHLRAGDELVFRKSSEAKPGDLVLLKDKNGNLYPRKLRTKLGDQLIAFSPNDAYEPLDISQSELEIVGVCIQVRANAVWF